MTNDPVKITDVILHKNQYYTQTFLILNRMPKMLYEKSGIYLIGEDSGFFNFYRYERPGQCFQAFAGREFDIPMKDGSIIKAAGQWWDCIPPDYSELNLLDSFGVSTIEELNKYNVFCSRFVEKEVVTDWLRKNEAGNNYYKYDKKMKGLCGQHQIVSKWE